MAVCVKVVIDDIVSKIDKPYDYYVPHELEDAVCKFGRVIVPFSRANTKKKALVLEVFEKNDIAQLKPVISVVDSEPILNDIQALLLELLKTRYFVTYFRALKSLVPRGIDFIIKEKYVFDDSVKNMSPALYELNEKTKGNISSSDLTKEVRSDFFAFINQGLITKSVSAKQNVGILSEKRLALRTDINSVEQYIEKIGSKYPKQKDLLSVFLDYTELSLKDALYYSGCTESTVKTLANKGFIDIVTKPIERDPYKDIEKKLDMSLITLSEQQRNVFESISESFNKYKSHLIHGVTGSGKTLIYISLIDKALEQGRSAIFMVPEISLTPQMLERFYSRYGDMVAVVHSGLAPGERADEWRKIKKSNKSVIVGTRSAVFSPVNNLGLIIIDEEHEPSYKSESAPRFHARDISKYICSKLDIPLVLGSATPSVESCYYAKRSIYSYHVLNKRFNNSSLPKTEIVDLKNSVTEGSQSFLSERLHEAVSNNLEAKEQTILFLNRRGTHTLVGCRSCGHVEKCPNCGIALTYHSANNRCMCHYCGYNIKMYSKCPVCSGEHIKKLGIGTQLIASELESMFPKARILRMDFDTVGSYVEYGKRLSSFKNGDYDIMLGTQMVAKGLDFPNVTLVGVINADLSLHIDDFRAAERTFCLLTQVSGRSGRAGKEGISIIQTYSPEHEIIRFSEKQDYNSYFDYEIAFRKAMNYPPFCDLIRFTVTSVSEKYAYRDIMELYKFLDSASKTDYSDIPIRMLYPTAHRIAKFNDRFRYNLVIKTKISKRLYELLNNIQNSFDDNKNSDISINVNPINNV